MGENKKYFFYSPISSSSFLMHVKLINTPISIRITIQNNTWNRSNVHVNWTMNLWVISSTPCIINKIANINKLILLYLLWEILFTFHSSSTFI